MAYNDFQISRDFSLIRWPVTFGFNALRASCAGIVLATLSVFMEIGYSAIELLVFVFGYPLLALIVIIPASLIFSWLAFIPFIGLLSMLLSFFIAIGDPLLWVLHKIFPGLIPIDFPPLFSLKPLIYVLSPFKDY